MKSDPVNSSVMAAGALAVISSAAGPAPDVNDLIQKIRNPDDAVRGPAWQGADQYGVAAVPHLVALMADTDMETARCAKRALWKIVSLSGRDGTGATARAVSRELLARLSGAGTDVQREILWMLSEIAGEDTAAALAAFLGDKRLREDTRCVLQRLPGRKAAEVLRSALPTAPDDFKSPLQQAMDKRAAQRQ